jgi:hypothetical protein
MAEILEEIKKMSREEQQALMDQIYVLLGEPELSGHEAEMLKSRAQEAKRNGFPGRSAEDVLAELEKD